MATDLLNRLPRWICGFTAGVLAIWFLYRGRSELPVIFASLFLLLICVTDTLCSKIPNICTGFLIVCGFALHGYLDGGTGLLTALLGLLTGFALLIVPYLLGGMGAGDVKALAALGALLGAPAILQVSLYMALAGGLMSILHYMFSPNLLIRCRAGLNALTVFFYSHDIKTFKPAQQSDALRFPYAAAIAFGFFAHNYWGNLI